MLSWPRSACQRLAQYLICILVVRAACNLVRGISQTNCGIKLFEPCGVGQKWGGAACSEWDFTKPRVKVLLTEFPNVGMAVDYDIVACLCDVNAIKHVKEALLLEGHG